MNTDVADELRRLAPEQQRRLLRRLRERRQAAELRPRPDPDGLAPLSHAQERLWFLDQLQPGSPAFNVAFGLRVAGPLDRERLRRALDLLVARHESLRTVLVLEDGQPRQRVGPPPEVDLPEIDLRPLPPGERPAAVDRHAAEHARIGFDLARGPLLAVRLLATGDDEHLLLVNVHHAVFDGWSATVFANDLAALYEGTPLAALPVQFGDYAWWEREHLQGEAMEAHLAHWRDRLAGAPVLSTLPADRPRPPRPAHRGGHHRFSVPAALVDGLAALSRQHGVTAFAPVLAAAALVLADAAGQHDVVVGTPVAARTRRELEPMIGCFANTLVLRLDLSGDPTHRELVGRAGEVIRDAYRHQEAPYASVVEAVAPPRDSGHNPLFQVMVNYVGAGDEVAAAGGTSFTPVRLEGDASDFDLFLTLTHGAGELHGSIRYDADLYIADTIARAADRLLAVLGDMVADPDRRPATHLADAARVGPGRDVREPEPGVAPRGETERRLAALWADVLGLETVSVTASFFALGGHSLLATRLLHGIQAEFGRRIPLHEFFRRPTIERVAALLSGEPGEPEDAELLPPVTRAPRDRPPPASSAQERLWALAQLDGRSIRHNMTFAGQVRGPLDEAALRRALAEVVRRHDVLRTTFAERDGRPEPVVHEDAAVWLEPPGLADGAARRWIDEQAVAPFDLGRGPLLRAALVRTGPDEHRLLIGMHHIVCDNWSCGLLFRELETLYEAFAGGRPSPLPEVALQYADYAAWQRERAHDRDLRYWTDRLRDAPPLLRLRWDGPRPAVQSHRGARVTRLLSAELANAVRELASGEATTPYATLLAAFAALLHRCSGEDQILLGTPTSGRPRPELEAVIGYFADIMPFRVEVAGPSSFRAHVRRVHELLAEAFEHGGAPFAEIVEAVRPARDPAHHPIFQSLFSFLEESEQRPALAGVEVVSDDVPREGTDFDLFLTAAWEGDRLRCSLEHNTDVFGAETAGRILDAYEAVLRAAVGDPDAPVGELPVDPSLVAAAARPVVVAASFTADPLGGSLEFWLRRLGLPAHVAFAPYNQVVQQLLDPASLLAGAGEGDGLAVVLLRWEDWLRFRTAEEASRPREAVGRFEENLHELLVALRGFAERNPDTELLVGVCPGSATFANEPWASLCARMEERLVRGCADLPRVTVVRAARMGQGHEAGVSDDARAEELGHIPYTPDYYRVLGTVLARRALSSWTAPRPWIVLDPARLLYRAGDGGRVVVEARHLRLARFLRDQVRGGRRLALGTSARPEEVREALDAHPELLLRWERAAARRAGGDLPDLLEDLAGANELELAGCVVLDADPAVCARVSARHPEALAVTLPADDAGVARVLQNLWALDDLPRRPAAGGDGAAARAGVLREVAETVTGAASLGRLMAGASGPRGSTAFVAARTERERALAEIWAATLHVDRVGVEDDFFELGGDSMLAIQVVSRASRAGIALTPRDLVARPRIADLAGVERRGVVAEQSAVVGTMPLTPPQRWWLERVAARLPDRDHFNHPYLLDLLAPIDPSLLERAVRHLARHHDALRVRLSPAQEQSCAGADEELPFEHHDLSGLPATERERAAEAIVSREQRRLDLAHGPVSRALHLAMGDGARDRLLFVSHHLATDGMSRAILLEDLETVCRQLLRGEEPALPPKTTSYRRWAHLLAAHAQTDRAREELDYWLEQARPEDEAIPIDHPGGVYTFGSIDVVTTWLDEDQTARLAERAARDLRVRTSDLLVAALAAEVQEWTGRDSCTIMLAGHGREDLFEDVDLSRTVGWFQVYYPVRLDRGDLRSVKSRLDGVPSNGLGFGVLRYVREEPAARQRLAAMPDPQVSFNYLGEYGFDDMPGAGDLFTISPASYGPTEGAEGVWPYLVNFVPSVTGRRLRIDVRYSGNLHRRTTVEGLAERVRERLLRMLEVGR